MVHVYTVAESNMYRLEEKVGKLARRASKLGVTPIRLTRVGEEVRSIGERPVRFILVQVEGVAPMLGGWALTGIVDHTTEGGNLLRALPGETIPAQFRDAAPSCQHCDVSRRRNETFILRDEGGDIKQVGRTCLGDFTGVRDPHAAAAMAEMLGDVAALAEACGEDDGFGGVRSTGWWLSEVLAVAAQFILLDGFVSRAKANELDCMATAEAVLIDLGKRRGRVKISDEAYALAKHAQAWVEDEIIVKEVKSDYEHNLAVAMASPMVQRKTIGLAVSAVGVYLRRQQDAEAKGNAVNEFVGKPGDKIAASLTLTGTRSLSGTYGPSTLLTFRDEHGRGFKWFATGVRDDFRVGETYRVSGAVKKHEEYKGRKETVLTRCTVS